MRITITIGDLSMMGELNDSVTSRKISEALPIDATFNTWGDEIYFSIPVDSELESAAQERVEMGDLGYWPTGNAFCIFFGPTPMSEKGEIIPASAVNVIGRIAGDARAFKRVMGERHVTVAPASSDQNGA